MIFFCAGMYVALIGVMAKVADIEPPRTLVAPKIEAASLVTTRIVGSDFRRGFCA